ncbi:hypothetical protein [Luteolibacter sp. LG18]|uniref:hypothetical protein n=1 Tax=Luteolibacter sp. LG18 TaxID=2819286 RepID=UPI002B296024|nr:hypothetical protein llg_26580 [Luteolibacter sp. LG18]
MTASDCSHPPDRPRILIGICTCLKNVEKRGAVRDTWLSTCPPHVRGVFFLGEAEGAADAPEDQSAADIRVVPGVSDGYHHLPAKVRGFFKLALQAYDFDWLFKCDDDTYVAADRLGELTLGGHDHVADAAFFHYRGAGSGGAGYLLSRRMVEELAADDSLPATGAEDLILSGAAAERCGQVLASDRLCYHNRSYPTRENNLITSHWLSPERMAAVHTIYTSEPWHVMAVSHPDWADEVRFYDNGVMARKSSCASGVWDVEDGEIVVMRWFEGPEDRMHVAATPALETAQP